MTDTPTPSSPAEIEPLREQIHSIIASMNRYYDKTGYYMADEMLDGIMAVVAKAIETAEKRGRIDEAKQGLNNLRDCGECHACYTNFCLFRDRLADLTKEEAK